MIDLLLDSNLTEQQRERATVAKSAADTLLALLNNVLDISKIEAGRLELDETAFHVRSVLSDTASLLAVRSEDKDIRLTYTVSDAVPDYLRGDPNRLRQILLNLLSNAIRFTERGEIAVRLDLETKLDREYVLHFSVSDTGIGIPPDKLDSVFDRFSQVDSSTTRKYGGTGLGLAISAQLTKAMGGRLWAESTLGKGSTFHFTARVRSTECAESVDGPATIQTLAMTDFTGTRVLLAEDNIFNQAVATELLKKLGCHVVVAANGREAVDAAQARPFDIVLMDVQMPEMDGLEATRTIRAHETSGRIPIIAQTAHAFADDKKRCFDVGMDDYIAKPIKTSELLKVLGRFLSTSRPTNIATYSPSEKNDPGNDEIRTADPHVFDLDSLRKRLDGDEDAIREMVELFFSYTPQLVADVRSAVQAEDWPLLTKLSHTLKGGCATFGADRITDIAKEMEQLSQEPGRENLWPLLSRLDTELQVLKRRVAELGYAEQTCSLNTGS